jgi:hypothetical protein
MYSGVRRNGEKQDAELFRGFLKLKTLVTGIALGLWLFDRVSFDKVSPENAFHSNFRGLTD